MLWSRVAVGHVSHHASRPSRYAAAAAAFHDETAVATGRGCADTVVAARRAAIACNAGRTFVIVTSQVRQHEGTGGAGQLGTPATA